MRAGAWSPLVGALALVSVGRGGCVGSRPAGHDGGASDAGSDATPRVDAGPVDARPVDAGRVDAAGPRVDAGPPDSGVPDSGVPDSGAPGVDAGTGCPTGTVVPGWTAWSGGLPGANKVVGMLAFAPNDMWIAGTSNDIFRFDGTTLTAVQSFNTNTIWGTDSNNVWLAGGSGTITQWDGTIWNDRTPKGVAGFFSLLFGFSANDVWVVGTTPSNTAMVMHWDGQQWTDRSAGVTSRPINMWGTSSSDLWVASFINGVVSSAITFLHWDGATWMTSGDPTDAQHQGRGPASMWGNGPDDVWSIVTINSGGSEVWHYDGTAWSVVHTLPTNVVPGAVARWSANDVWVAARVTDDPYPRLAALHFDGTSWALERAGDFGTLTQIVAIGPGELWAGHDDNRSTTLYHRHLVPCGNSGPGDVTGAGFEIVGPAPATMLGIGSGDLWGVVGANVSRLSGTTWVQPFADPDPALSAAALFASGPNDLWVAARAVYESDGVIWTDRTPPAPPAPTATHNVVAAWAGAPNDVWLGVLANPTADPPLIHWDGTTWTGSSVPAVPNYPFWAPSALWGSSSHDVWLFASMTAPGPVFSAVGFFHWDGSGWTLLNDISSTASTCQSAVSAWGSGSHDVWLGCVDASSHLATWHFDGSTWSIADRADVYPPVGSIWGSGPSDVWVTAAGMLRHFDGAIWSTVDPHADALSQVTGAGGHDLWVRGLFYGTRTLLHLRR